METHRQKKENLDQVLKAVYMEKESAGACTLDQQWRDQLMRRIRRLDAVKAANGFFELFEAYLWRMAPAASVLILLFSFWIFQHGLSPDVEVAAVALSDPIGYGLLQPFGL